MTSDIMVMCMFGCGFVLGVTMKWVYDNGYNTKEQNTNNRVNGANLMSILSKLFGRFDGGLVAFKEDLKIGDEFASIDISSKSLWVLDSGDPNPSSKIKIINIKRDLSGVEYVFTEIDGKDASNTSSKYITTTRYIYERYTKL